MFKKIALAHDGSVHAERALAYATALAKQDDAPMLIVHVDEEVIAKGGGPLIANEDDVEAKIKETAERLKGEGLDVTVRVPTVRLGGPAPAILDVASEEGADVIVAGSTGISSLDGLFLGSVTHKLLHLAKQPVLMVPPSSKLSETADEATAAVSA